MTKRIRCAYVVLCLLLAACPHDNGPSSPSGGAANVLPISVGASNVCSNVNELCASVTICQPGTSNCHTISDVLVDIGSVGLRLFASVVSVPLQQEVDGQGHPLGTCALFADGGATWGPVQLADVELGGEPAVRIPIQVIDPTFAGQSVGSNPCGTPVDSAPNTSLFNGILGIGIFKQDCGPTCAVDASPKLYFSCNGSTCTSIVIPVQNQLQNPVWMLPSGNNGVMVSLPSVPASGAPSVTGSLTLGIGAPPAGVTVLTADVNGLVRTNYKGTLLQAIIDTGSNGYFFPDNTLATCAAPLDSFYCPPNPVNLMGTLIGLNGAQLAVPFQVANAQNLLQANPNNGAFNNVAGVSGGMQVFDWGLPLFFGRTVIVGIEQEQSPLGMGPYFAL